MTGAIATTLACHECVHHRILATGATACRHPLTAAAHKLPIAATIEAMGHALPLPVPGMRVTASQQAIVLGWWSWPYSYDPAWLVDCDKFEAE